MKNKHLYSLLDLSFVTIRVMFLRDELKAEAEADALRQRFGSGIDHINGRTYIYKAPRSYELEVGDFVVVDSPRGLAVVKVTEAHELPQIDVDADFDYKWIVQKVDRTDYDKRVKREQEFAVMMFEVERTRQREAIVNDMRNLLPEGSKARELFEDATKLVESVAAPEAPLGGKTGSDA